jgi:D-cysteine desulfhydrase
MNLMRLNLFFIFSFLASSCLSAQGYVSLSSSTFERDRVDLMFQYVTVPDAIKESLYALAQDQDAYVVLEKNTYDRPLFAYYPQLAQEVFCLELADLPTPVTPLVNLSDYFDNRVQLFQKNDGLTGRIEHGQRFFGGNKVRKLEFLLADALMHNAQSVMTYGAIGSNHVVATGACCKQLGLRCSALLTPQPVGEIVRRNLLLMRAYDIDIMLNPNRAIRNLQTVCSFVQSKYHHGQMPYLIPTGGSCPIGALGFVNAAFELREQIGQGLLPEPDYIYVPVGSCGTITGLMLGVRAANLKSRVVGVGVFPDAGADPYFVPQIVALLNQTNLFIAEKDPSFPLFIWDADDVEMLLDFGGAGYAIPSLEAEDAKALFQTMEGVLLDTTYSAKAAAGMLDDIAAGSLDNSVVLFWNTFCADAPVDDATITQLPKLFQNFFE